jgi:hypothetical protein
VVFVVKLMKLMKLNLDINPLSYLPLVNVRGGNQRCKPATKRKPVWFLSFQNLSLRVWVPDFYEFHSGFGFGFRVRKFSKKKRFWVQVWDGFCKKKHQNINEIFLKKLFFLYFEMSLTVFY